MLKLSCLMDINSTVVHCYIQGGFLELDATVRTGFMFQR